MEESQEFQTALDIADAGYEVDIVKRGQVLAERMSQLDKTFPTLDCSACILTPKMVKRHMKKYIFIPTVRLKKYPGLWRFYSRH